MARRAPAVERAIAVLNHLAANPGERFTLSEIAREVSLNKATLHAILGALVEAGYLLRDDGRKTYGLGPALVALGGAAVDAYPAVQVAVPQMQSLSDDLGLDCVGSSAIGDEIVVLARTVSPRPFGIAVQAGQRIPLAPPLGTVFVAWSSPGEIDRWLSKVDPSLKASDIARYRKAVEAVRERGFSVGLEPPRVPPVRGKRGAPTLAERVRQVGTEEYALVELERSASYRLNHIGAPVFGPDGRVALALFLIGFQGDIASDEVPRYAGRLRDAASRVTQAIHGREPAA